MRPGVRMQVEAGSENVLSFRRFLSAEISDCVSCFRQPFLSADLLAEFILIHSRYQEEGDDLFPVVFLGESLQGVLTVAGGQDPIEIGSGGLTRSGVQQAFKRCAPLAADRAWAIFVILEEGVLRYGIFRTEQSPLRPTSFAKLRQARTDDISVVGLVRMGMGFVEVRSSRGWFRYVNLTREQEETENPRNVIQSFIEIVSRHCPAHLSGELQSFYYRCGFDILQADHGTLLAVIDHRHGNPKIFDDGVSLSPRIEVVSMIEEILAENSNEAFLRLASFALLLRKMTSMDGITVVDSSGSIVGYNYFVRSAALGARGETIPAGGARRRAFDALCSHLGEDLLAVIYKSRDGAVEIGIAK